MMLFDVDDVVKVKKTGEVLSVVDYYSDGISISSYFCSDGKWHMESELGAYSV